MAWNSIAFKRSPCLYQSSNGFKKYLDKILSRVLGDLIARKILVKIADDLIIGANTIDKLFSNYTEVLQRLQKNNL